jgi:hypothetical protein
LGAKAEATNYFGLPLGFHMGPPQHEFFGRRRVFFDYGAGFGLGVWGMQLRSPDDSGQSAGLEVFRWMNIYLAAVNASAITMEIDRRERSRHPLPWHQRFRFGGELWLPWVTFGLFLNPVEIIDLLGGIAGLDLCEDDGLPWGVTLYPKVEEPRETPQAPPAPAAAAATEVR